MDWGILEKSIETIHGEDTHEPPFWVEMLLTPAGDIIPQLIVGMKFMLVVIRQEGFKR